MVPVHQRIPKAPLRGPREPDLHIGEPQVTGRRPADGVGVHTCPHLFIHAPLWRIPRRTASEKNRGSQEKFFTRREINRKWRGMLLGGDKRAFEASFPGHGIKHTQKKRIASDSGAFGLHDAICRSVSEGRAEAHHREAHCPSRYHRTRFLARRNSFDALPPEIGRPFQPPFPLRPDAASAILTEVITTNRQAHTPSSTCLGACLTPWCESWTSAFAGQFE